MAGEMPEPDFSIDVEMVVSLRRHTSTLVLGAVLVLPLAMPASAATPAFDFDIEVSGSTIEVTVEFEPVPPGFAWGSFEASGVPDELVGLFTARDVDDRGRPVPSAEPLLLSLKRVDWGVYHDSVQVPDGHWAVVAWPFSTRSYTGAARTEIVAVGDPEVSSVPAQAEDGTAGGPPVWIWIVLGAAIASGVTLAAGRNAEHT